MPNKETVTEFVVQPPVGWPCPHCGGWGRMMDGMSSYSYDAATGKCVMRHREASKCPTCDGKGRVLVTPVPD